MKEINLTIDDQALSVSQDTTILQPRKNWGSKFRVFVIIRTCPSKARAASVSSR